MPKPNVNQVPHQSVINGEPTKRITWARSWRQGHLPLQILLILEGAGGLPLLLLLLLLLLPAPPLPAPPLPAACCLLPLLSCAHRILAKSG